MKRKILFVFIIAQIILLSIFFLIPSQSYANAIPSCWFSPVIGYVGTPSFFNLTADNCKDLAWTFTVDRLSDPAGNVFTAPDAGTVPSNSGWWHGETTGNLIAGNYIATLTITGGPSYSLNFSVFTHTVAINVIPGYAGQQTSIEINVTGSDAVIGKNWRTWLYQDGVGNYPTCPSDVISVNPCNLVLNFNLTEGKYYFTFGIDQYLHPDVNKGDEQLIFFVEPSPSGSHPVVIETKTNTGFATSLYNRILHRDPDGNGLAKQVAALDGGLTRMDIVYNFIFSEECQNKISGYTNEQFIKFLYLAIFGREADSDGLAFWLAHMDSGMTRADVVYGFTHSLEFEYLYL